jgi:ABC-type multidrug transport system fused ATPase/permease subunit
MAPSLVRALGFLTVRERLAFSGLVFARMLTGVLDVVGILLIGFIAGGLATRANVGASGEPVTLLGIEVPFLEASALFAIVCVVLAVFLVKAILAILLTRILTYFVSGIETRAAIEITGQILRGPLLSLKNKSTSQVQYGVTSSSTYAFTGLLNNVATLATESFLLVVIVSTLIAVNPMAALFTALYFASFVALLQLVIARTLRLASQEAVTGTLDTMSRIADATSALREIQIMGRHDFFTGSIAEARRRISRSGAEMTFLAALPRYVVETALILGVVLLLGQQLLDGELASGLTTIGVFLTGGVRLMASLLPLQSALANIKQNGEQAKAALDLIDEVVVPLIPLAGGKIAEPVKITGAPQVNLTNVVFSYPGLKDVKVLEDVSLEIPAGSFAAIIGPSGAGKTTLVDLILGIMTPTTGTVVIGGPAQEASGLRPTYVASYVTQKPGLISGSIAQNVAFGIPDAAIDRQHVREALAKANLGEFVSSLPEGIDTSVGQQVDAMSGGQIQRIALARAFYHRPQILVLDEATSGLDANSESSVVGALRELAGDTTVIVVTHRLSTAKAADVVHVLEGGKLSVSGTFEHVSKINPTVADYVKLMSLR